VNARTVIGSVLLGCGVSLEVVAALD